MNILALDLGTRTGWATNMTGRVESGVQIFDVKRGESPGMRYIRFNRWLDELVVSDVGLAHVGLVVYEQSHNRGGAATEVAAGFTTRVQEFCALHKKEHAAIHSATLKKFTTGSGRGDKADMERAAIAKGWLIDGGSIHHDDNQVDAVCLLQYALAEIVPAGVKA